MNETRYEHELPAYSKSPHRNVLKDSSSATTSIQHKSSRSEHSSHQDGQMENQESHHDSISRRDAALLPSSVAPARDRSSSPESDWDDRDTTVPLKPLTTFDLGALVFNKMVGTGIFTVPGHVLKATGSKWISIVLWIAGGVYTALCLTAYLELGAEFPYDGGELIYLDRTLRPRLMWTMAFATFFITIANTSGNAIAFARFVMIAGLPTKTGLGELDSKIVKLIAINIVSVVCLLHYFSHDLGRLLNKLLATYKLCLLMTVMIAGFWAASRRDGEFNKDVKEQPESQLGGIVLILYSFTGWENANYVAGEINKTGKDESGGNLPKGAYTAIGLVTVMYVLVASSYYLAFPYKDIVDSLDLGMARNLGPMAFRPGGVSLDILFALSAFGNLIAVVYTSSRVKQAIARQRLLPFWRYLEKDKASPKGGLFIHWLFTTIMVLAAPVGPDGYSFIVGLYTYGQIVVVTFAVLGLLRMLELKAKDRKERRLDGPSWTSETVLLRSRLGTRCLIGLIFGMNMLVIFMAAFQKPGKDEPRNPIPGWLWPVVAFSIFGGGIIAWLSLVLLQSHRSAQKLGIHVRVHEVSDTDMTRPVRPNGNDAAQPSERSDNQFEGREDRKRRRKREKHELMVHEMLKEASDDGTNRRLEITLTGFPEQVAGWLRRRRRQLKKSIM